MNTIGDDRLTWKSEQTEKKKRSTSVKATRIPCDYSTTPTTTTTTLITTMALSTTGTIVQPQWVRHYVTHKHKHTQLNAVPRFLTNDDLSVSPKRAVGSWVKARISYRAEVTPCPIHGYYAISRQGNADRCRISTRWLFSETTPPAGFSLPLLLDAETRSCGIVPRCPPLDRVIPWPRRRRCSSRENC